VRARFCLACAGPLRRRRVEGSARLRCARCGWVFYANPVPAVVAVIMKRGRLLLARRARPPYAGTWDAPGGFLEAGETPEQGLRRELREEIGVGVQRARFLGFATDRYGPRGFAVLAAAYRVTPTSFAMRAQDDVSEVRWFEATAIPWQEIAFPGLRRLLRRALGGKPMLAFPTQASGPTRLLARRRSRVTGS
jgi:ADP-ribose pyrophosphatase YjhB (NUDIX family)